MSLNILARVPSGAAIVWWSLCLGAYAVAVGAQSESFVPADLSAGNPLARIGISPRDLARRKTAVDIRCQTFVEIDGDLADYYCVPPDAAEDQQVTRRVVEALEDLTFAAAGVDGAPVRVLMNFTVSIRCADDGCTVTGVPNHGYHAGALGEAYVSPQPIVPGPGWYDGYQDKLGWIHGWMPNLSYRFNQTAWPMRPTIAVAVAADGTGTRGCISSLRLIGDDEEQRNRQKLDKALQSIGETRFVPGFHQGQPVSMAFFEHGVFENAASLVSRPPRGFEYLRFTNRYFVRRLSGPDEAPELYCTA